MQRRFSFEKAVGYAFSAPGAAVFIPLYAFVYALIGLASYGAIAWAAGGTLARFMRTVEADDAPDALMSAAGPLIGWALLLLIWSWVLWAVFEVASQRRYIFHRPFSLSFGGDELRMMGVGVFWFLLSLALWGVPFLLISGAVAASLDGAGQSSDAAEGGVVLGVLGVLLVAFPLYAFLATRLSPSFGQTVKEGRIRFIDAWNISRGRFWPILGAFVVIAFGTGIVTQVVTGVAQGLIVPQLAQIAGAGGGVSAETLIASFSQPGTLAAISAYAFITLFMQGLTQHVNGAPAALAARTDPRGGVDDLARIDAFS